MYNDDDKYQLMQAIIFFIHFVFGHHYETRGKQIADNVRQMV